MNRKVFLMVLILLLSIMLNLYAQGAQHKRNQRERGIVINKAAPSLHDLLTSEEKLPELIPVYIVMAEQVDAEWLYERVKHLPKDERRAYTINTLKRTSEDSQRELLINLRLLEDKQMVRRIKAIWISNIIGLEASIEALQILDQRSDIDKIEYDPPQRFLEELPEAEENSRLDRQMERSNQNTREMAYHVTNVNAPQVWDLGVTGEGVVVAVIDSGVNYNHNDIRDRMWSHPDFPHHGYNFWEDNDDPMDQQGHGTHCAGIIAGDGTSGTQSGIAPGAKIMAIKPLHGFTGQHQTFWQGVQFAVEYGADILSVSMYWRHTLLDNVTRSIFRTIMVNTLSAGVILSKSAGNDGSDLGPYPVPYNVNIPAGSPAPWLHPDQTIRSGVSCVVSVGAIDINNLITAWSSVGPATWQGVPGWDDYHYDPTVGNYGITKPDIVAPGANVKSLIHSNNVGYTNKSGTSMAAPCVAGVMALMLSKNPHMSPENVSRIIEETAVPYVEVKNNIYGAGRIDALAAVNASTMIGVKKVTVSDDNNDIPEYGETVNLNISLINSGVEVATGINATLSTTDNYIEIIEAFAEFGNIEKDSTVTAIDAYRISISESAPDQHLARFNLTITSEDERVWHDRLLVEIRAPQIVIDTVIVTDNNNNTPESGEEISLRIDLANIGGSQARNVAATLTSNNQYVEIIEESSGYPDINVDENKSNNELFVVSIAPDTPHNTRAIFTLTIEGGEGQAWHQHFWLDIQAPVLSLNTPFIYDPFPGGNSNGILDPGEELFIFLPIQNVGGSVSELMNINVTNNDQLINDYRLLNVAETPMQPGEIFYPALWVAISEAATDETVFAFKLEIETGEYLFHKDLTIGVGGIVQIRIGDGELVNGGQAPNPINIYFRSLRSQTIYTAEEIRAAGFTGGGEITALGYYIVETPEYHLNNFLIRMAHTTATDAQEHIEGPYTPVYQDNYIPIAGRWDMLTLRTPFVWNGIDNLLVDTAFPTVGGWSDTGQTLIYNSANGFRYCREDIPDQTDKRTNEVSDDKPQITMRINTALTNNLHKPRELTLNYVENGIQLEWIAPDDNQRGESAGQTFPTPERSEHNSRRRDIQQRAPHNERNFQGYNVYRNGVKINENLITNTQFTDRDEVQFLSNYYHVTAVYEVGESLPSNVVLPGAIENIEISHQEGNYFEPIEIRLSSQTPQTTIYYTLDGSQPDENSNLFNQPFLIDYHTTLKCKAYRENWIPSEIVAAEYHILYAPRNLEARVDNYDVFLYWEEAWSPTNDRDDETVTRRKTNNRTTLLTRDYLLGYNIYRSAQQDSFLLLNEEPITTDEYKDSNLEDGRYRYYVKSQYIVGESDKSRIIQVPVGAAEADEELISPLKTELYAAFPNPFNPSTTIEFALETRDRVIIDIYDIKGKKMVTLKNETMEQGRYKVLWNGCDKDNRQVSSGIYLYRLKTSHYEDIKKAVLLK